MLGVKLSEDALAFLTLGAEHTVIRVVLTAVLRIYGVAIVAKAPIGIQRVKAFVGRHGSVFHKTAVRATEHLCGGSVLYFKKTRGKGLVYIVK